MTQTEIFTPAKNGMAAPFHPTATPAVATAPRHPCAHTGNPVRYTNTQTARTRDSRTKLALATALLSLTHALSSQRCCNTCCHQMPCKPASCTQHSTTSLHLFRLRASSARTLNSELQSCKPNSPATATEMHTFCCHALYDLTGRSFTDLSVPAINTTNKNKTNKTTKTINATTHKHSQPKQYQHHKLTNPCPLTTLLPCSISDRASLYEPKHTHNEKKKKPREQRQQQRQAHRPRQG
jgi:hypothetical protein